MSQTWTPTFSASDFADTALETAIPANFASLRSNFSGSSAPSSTTPYMLWADTGTGWLKIRNAADSAWLKVAPLATDFVLPLPGTQFNIASLSATTTARLGAVPRAGNVLGVKIVCDTASTSSGGNEWQVSLKKRTAATPGSTVNLFTATVGTFTSLSGVYTGGDLVAFKVATFLANQNSTVVVDDALELTMTKVGTATTLVNAMAWAVME
jgi:hypothetical protein